MEIRVVTTDPDACTAILGSLRSECPPLVDHEQIHKSELRGLLDNLYYVVASIPVTSFAIGTATGIVANWIYEAIKKSQSPNCITTIEIRIAFDGEPSKNIIVVNDINRESITNGISQALHKSPDAQEHTEGDETFASPESV